MHKKTLLGLFGAFGIWLTAGLALPFVNVLDMFTPTQLMTLRGLLGAVMALIGLRGKLIRADKYTYLIAIVLPLATLGLFQGIRYWGAGPTIIILTATPIINLAFSKFTNRRISSASIIGLLLILGGVIIARWNGAFNWEGFLWTVFATIANGVLYELFSRAKSASLQKCFWAFIGMGSLGLLLSLNDSWTPIFQPQLALLIVGFAFVGGFLYWVANLLTFTNLPTVEASVLAQGETPAVIISAYFLLGEQLTVLQWIGVIIALGGACILSYWLSKQSNSSVKQKDGS